MEIRRKMETKIVRYETIIVTDVRENSYGDLVVNGGIKVNKKRSNLFSVFQVGAEVKLGYGNYMDKDYVATAEQTGKHIVKADPTPDDLAKAYKEAVKELPKPTQEAPQSKSSPVNPQSNTMTPSGQEIGMTTKEIGDMIRANKLSVIFGEETSKKLVEWYKNRIKSTTGS